MNILKYVNLNKQLLIIDMISLLKFSGLKNDFSPRTQLQVLRKLSKFSLKEKINIIAVLSGQPLHKAPKGKKFDNIKVYYSSSLETHPKKIASLAILKSGILVTNDESAEIKVRNITETMKISTFRKAFDPISDYDRYDNYDSRRNKKFIKYDVNKRESSTDNTKNNEAINELIDLVD